MCQDCSQVSFDIVQMVDQRECYLIWCVGVAGWHPILRSPPQNRHTNVLLPLYSIIRPMCLGPQRKQAFLYMTRMSLIFMEVNKCTRMEGVFHSRRLTMGPLCSLILQLLYLNIPTIYYTVWMNIVFSGQNIYLRRLCEIFSGHWKQGSYTLSLFLTLLLLLILFLVFKRQYCWIFFTKAPFCAASVTNCCRSTEWPGSLWVMSSQSCLRVVLPPRHISAYPHHRDVTEYSLVSLTCSCLSCFLHIFWQFHINLFTSVQSSVPCYRNNILRPL